MATAEEVAGWLEAWRRTRDPELADRLDGAKVAFEPPKVKVVTEASAPPYMRTFAAAMAFHDAWLRVAKAGDDAAIPWLVDNLTTKLPDLRGAVRVTPPTGQALIDRVKVLAKREPDPRVARALAALVAAAPLSGDPLRAIYGPMLAALVHHRDPRQAEPLTRALRASRARAKMVRDWLAAKLPETIAALAPATGSTSRSGRNAVPRREPPSVASGEALLTAIYDGGDDASRAVYADWLSSRGDPRGELIALQLGEPSRERDVQIRKLLREHADAWLGDLRPLLKNVRFARGFPEAAELASSWSGTKELWKGAIAEPGLATLVELRQGKANSELYRAFVTSPAMRGLRRVEARDEATLAAIGGRHGGGRPDHVEVALKLFLASADRIPATSSLGLTSIRLQPMVDALPAIRLPAGVTALSLRVQDGYGTIDELLGGIAALWKRPQLASLAIVDESGREALALVRAGASIELHVRARHVPDVSGWTLPPGARVARARLVTPTAPGADALAAIRKHLRATKLDVDIQPASEIAADLDRLGAL